MLELIFSGDHRPPPPHRGDATLWQPGFLLTIKHNLVLQGLLHFPGYSDINNNKVLMDKKVPHVI